jgi:hypothetical protein
MTQGSRRIIALADSAAIAAAVLVAAAAAARAGELMPPAAQPFAATTFFAVVGAIALFTPTRMLEWHRDTRLVVALALSGLAVLSLRAGDVAGLCGTSVAAILTVVYAAWVEESVFRRILPRAFGRSLASFGERRAHAAGILVSQALFAAGHFMPGTIRYIWPDAAAPLRLFAGGLLLWLVASRGGLTIAVIAHSLFNLRSALPGAALQARPTIIGIALTGALAVTVLFLVPTSLSHQPFTARSHA